MGKSGRFSRRNDLDQVGLEGVQGLGWVLLNLWWASPILKRLGVLGTKQKTSRPALFAETWEALFGGGLRPGVGGPVTGRASGSGAACFRAFALPEGTRLTHFGV